MSERDEDSQQKLALGVVGAVVAAVVIGVIYFANKGAGTRDPLTEAASAAQTTTDAGQMSDAGMQHAAANTDSHDGTMAAPPTDQTQMATGAATDTAAVSGTVLGQVFFGSGKTAVDAAQQDAIKTAADTVGQDHAAVLVLSGFHDTTGSAQANAEVAKSRALAVRDALVAQGVPVDRIRLEKPQVTVGGTDPKQSRRVDILLSR